MDQATDEKKKAILLEFAKQNMELKDLIERFDMWDEVKADYDLLTDDEREYVKRFV